MTGRGQIDNTPKRSRVVKTDIDLDRITCGSESLAVAQTERTMRKESVMKTLIANLSCLAILCAGICISGGAQQPRITGNPQAKPQGTVSQPDKPFPVPNISADLTASRTQNPEFAAYVKQLQLSSGQCFFRLTTAANAQKIVWQISSAPYGPAKSATEWMSAQPIATGNAAPGSSITQFTINLATALGPPPAKALRVYVRALAIKNNLLVAQPSNPVAIDYGGTADKITIVETTSNLPKDPKVVSSVSVVGYKPPIVNGDPFAFILTKTPPAGELKFVLQKIKATTPGTEFHLSPSEYEQIKKSLATDQKAVIALQDFLKVLKSGYNWLDDKYNFAANKLASVLAPIVGQENARKMINYYMAIYGFNPSYGNFDEALNTGKSAFSAFLMDNGDVPEDKKGNVLANANAFIDEVKYLANGGDDPNRFFRQNPEYAARPAIVILRVKYQAQYNPPASMKGGKAKIKVSIMSGRNVDQHTLTSTGYAEYAPVLLFEKSIEVPNAKAGTTFDLPVYVDYAPLFKNDNLRWYLGYDALKPGEITAGNDSLKVVASQKFAKP